MVTNTWRILFISLVTFACGCASVSLTTEDSVPELVELKAAAAGIPERTEFVRVRTVRGKPIRLAVHETGNGDASRVLVLVHGVLADSQSWRFMRGELSAQTDVMAVDLLGCGASDQPKPSDLGPDGYAPPALAGDVLAAVRARLASRADASNVRITLVGHSLGGTIILRMLSDEQLSREYADVLARVDGTVLFTPADVAVDPNQPAFRTVATVTDLEVAIASSTGILSSRVAAATREGVVEQRLAVREESARVVTILRDKSRRHAAAAMLKQAAPLQGPRLDRPDWERIEALTQNYSRIAPPCLIVWGGRDEVLPVSMGYKLAEEIPGARLRIITRGMHCLPLERPRECLTLLRDFVDSGGELTGLAKVAKFDVVPEPPFLALAESSQPRSVSSDGVLYVRKGSPFVPFLGVPRFLSLTPFVQIRPVFLSSRPPAGGGYSNTFRHPHTATGD